MNAKNKHNLLISVTRKFFALRLEKCVDFEENSKFALDSIFIRLDHEFDRIIYLIKRYILILGVGGMNSSVS